MLQQNFDDRRVIDTEKYTVPNDSGLVEIRRFHNDANNYFRAVAVFLLEQDFLHPEKGFLKSIESFFKQIPHLR